MCNCWSPVSDRSVYSYVGDRLRCTYGVIILVSYQLPHNYKPPFSPPNTTHYVSLQLFLLLWIPCFCFPYLISLLIAGHLLVCSLLRFIFCPFCRIDECHQRHRSTINHQRSTVTDQPDRCLLVDCRQERYNA